MSIYPVRDTTPPPSPVASKPRDIVTFMATEALKGCSVNHTPPKFTRPPSIILPELKLEEFSLSEDDLKSDRTSSPIGNQSVSAGNRLDLYSPKAEDKK